MAADFSASFSYFPWKGRWILVALVSGPKRPVLYAVKKNFKTCIRANAFLKEMKVIKHGVRLADHIRKSADWLPISAANKEVAKIAHASLLKTVNGGMQINDYYEQERSRARKDGMCVIRSYYRRLPKTL